MRIGGILTLGIGAALVVALLGGAGLMGERGPAVASEVADVGPAVDPSATPTGLDYRFGAHIAQLDDANGLQDITDAGLGVARAAIVWWQAIEPVQGQYYTGTLDTQFGAAAARNVQVLATVSQPPLWALDTTKTNSNGQVISCGPLRDADAYNAFAATMGMLARSYPQVRYWELFNEVDNQDTTNTAGGCFGHDPAEYVRMLQAVYPAVKAANPNAKVVFGGLAMEPGHFNMNFLRDVLAGGGGAYFDVMNFHYYPAFRVRWESKGPDVAGKAAAIREVLAQYGHSDKPLICTECGAWSGFGNGSPYWQAYYVPELAARALAYRLDLMIWFLIKDPPRLVPVCDPGQGWTQDFVSCEGHGLVEPDGTRKDAWKAFQTFLREVNGLTRVRALDRLDGVQAPIEGYEFLEPPKDDDSARRRFWVIWMTPEWQRPYTTADPIPSPTPGANYTPIPYTPPTQPIRAFDILSSTVTMGPGGRVTLSPAPVYLEMPAVITSVVQIPVPTAAPGVTTTVPISDVERTIIVEVPPAVATNTAGTPVPVTVRIEATPTPSAVGTSSLRPVSAVNVEMQTNDGTPVTQLARPMRVVMRYNALDLRSRGLDPNFMLMYTSEDGTTWEPLPTQLNALTGEASANVTHLSTFTLTSLPLTTTKQLLFVPAVSNLPPTP